MDKHTHSNTETSCRAGQVRGCLGEPTGLLAGMASGKLKVQNQWLLFAQPLSWFDIFTVMKYCFFQQNIDARTHAQFLPSCPTLCDLWTVICQAPLSMGFSRQEHWTGLLCPLPGNVPDPGVEPMSSACLELQADSSPTEPPGKT